MIIAIVVVVVIIVFLILVCVLDCVSKCHFKKIKPELIKNGGKKPKKEK